LIVSNGWPIIVPNKFETELANICAKTNFNVIGFDEEIVVILEMAVHGVS
jgi:hypothetical protein